MGKAKEWAGTILLVVMAAVVAFVWLAPAGSGIGTLAPETGFQLLSGEQRSMADFHGRPVLVTFWATSCPTCVEEIPDLMALHQEFGSDLAVLGVAMAHDQEPRVRALAEKMEIPYGLVYDQSGALAKAFGGVRITPTNILVGPDGQVVLRRMGKFERGAMAERIRALLQG